ncbi:MAG: glutaconyl-CoA/methylmalonyl-CoA decarboxylase subunit gamma [Epulopiscium sp.]|jgi:biotin carboxyl carrier protein|uniref:Biotin/lipoyl-binding protein n=1 Tax=Defluviitalea raffinosedens TaxID=1450156 RepID=A0A7C8HEE4_9FIRM|nr:biotin/lipoyl-containing protein [Defluviitalea raffinosedens]MBZ4667874.1 acetyl-CoA carboxylase biotin carboxyl carrier protein subunit [Defluviitaleaceae bacterium]MDK2788852.1 glutaconyl-CoA/methylmalonyl-CoA decarboxylase subunit gamma [Candidatus Epulonipiscium sp.]KAE9629845.1 biotin/lipoyl-binding protein [Defluviitalea raffinosedens]MBM7686645.1 biotin carboxyl carrier protein [Defluviitalea raffinosedens]HHW67872.1 biotin/lipoyl-binding protein [Candidatus Epulonipiscium sp.]
MRKFQVTVNGNIYEVEVEELQGGQAVTPAAAPATAAPAPAAPAAPKVAPQKASAPAAVPAGATKVTSPMPGTILDIKVSVGDSVKVGDTIAILEAMKMENEIVATADGKIASINTSKGASVNTGDLIATIG